MLEVVMLILVMLIGWAIICVISWEKITRPLGYQFNWRYLVSMRMYSSWLRREIVNGNGNS